MFICIEMDEYWLKMEQFWMYSGRQISWSEGWWTDQLDGLIQNVQS